MSLESVEPLDDYQNARVPVVCLGLERVTYRKTSFYVEMMPDLVLQNKKVKPILKTNQILQETEMSHHQSLVAQKKNWRTHFKKTKEIISYASVEELIIKTMCIS